MKINRNLILLPVLVLFSTLSFSQKENSTECSKRNRFSNQQLKSNSLTVSQISQTEKYDVHFYGLNLNMTNTNTNLNGSASMHASCVQNIDTILYELYPTLTISSVELNGTSVPFTRSNSAVKIAANLIAGSNFTIKTFYNGTPPTAQTNPLGGSGMTYATSPSWGNAVVWSLSEPFSAYEWWPCKQSLNDKADSSDINITVPNACKAGSNGLLTNVVNLGNGKTRYEWKHRHPIDYYLISVAVAQYIEYNIYANPTNAPAPILIQNFIYNNPQTLPYFQDEIDETVDFLNLFYDLYGPYPFEDEKYGHCMAPLSGGMEHQTMTTQGFFNKGLTSHELGHQWWGDHVTCASWSDIWVNEGFASYSEQLMLENLYPGQEIQNMLDVHDNVKTQPGGSVWVLDSLNENRIFSGRLTYDKGAAIIHTIRYMVNNDNLFFQTLQNFLTTHAESTAFGIDVRDAFIQSTGINFTPFFEQWYFGQGFPTYSVKWKQSGSNAIVQINQSVSMPNITPTFTNPIDLKFTRPGNSDTIIRFPISANSNTFTINGIGTINSSIGIDPENWVINNNGSIQMDNTLSIQEQNDELGITLIPNPSNGIFSIVGLKEPAFLQLYGMNGQLLKEMTIVPNQLIDIQALPKGTYLLSIMNTDGNKTLRLISH